MFLSSMVQEHERAVGGWQSEWATISSIVQETGLAVASMAEVAEGLTVDTARMRANLEATHGTIFAERATMLLSGKLGRELTSSLIERAVAETVATGRNFVDVLAGMREVVEALDAATLRDLQSAESYLGAAEEFRRRLAQSQKKRQSGSDNRKGRET